MGIYMQINFLITDNFGPVYKIIDFQGVVSYIFITISFIISIGHFFFGVLLYSILKKKKIEKIKYERVKQYTNYYY